MRHAIQIALAGAVLLYANGGAAARDLTVTSWGGAFQAIQNDVYFNPFRKETGIPLIDTTWNGGVGVIRTQVQGGNPSWDVVEVESDDLAIGCEEGLYEVLDFAKIGGKDRYLPDTVSKCGIGTASSAVVLGYDKDKLKDPPKTWADFFDTAKYPGRRALKSTPKGTLEIALLADGVTPDKVYDVLSTKEGVDRAFAKLTSLKKDLIFWTASAQAPQFLASGEVVMTSAYNGRLDAANLTDKRNFGMSWNGALREQDSWVILKNSPNIENAYKLIELMGRAKNQAGLSEKIAYGGSNKDATTLLSPDRQAAIPTSPDNVKVSMRISTDFWLANLDRLTERFNQWAGQ